MTKQDTADAVDTLIAKLDDFTEAYLVAALWATSDNGDWAANRVRELRATPGDPADLAALEQQAKYGQATGGDPLDAHYDLCDIALSSIQKAIDDCAKFRAENAKLLEGLDESQCGYDFWLTRNGHGTGFWDRGYPKEIGDALTEAAHAFGGIDPVVGDDDEVYIE